MRTFCSTFARQLFQGAVVPMYAIIVREYFSPQEAGMRVGVVVGATLLGMALGSQCKFLQFYKDNDPSI